MTKTKFPRQQSHKGLFIDSELRQLKLLSLALLLAAAFLFAAPVSARTDVCEEAVTQQEMNYCAQTRAEQLDLELQTKFKILAQQQTDSKRQQLESEQREWLEQREDDCDMEARTELDLSAGEGVPTLYPLFYAGCLQRKTKERITALEKRQLLTLHSGNIEPANMGICDGIFIPANWARRGTPPRLFREQVFNCIEIEQEVQFLDELDRDLLFRFAQQDSLEKLSTRKTKTTEPKRFDELLPIGKLERLRRLIRQAAQREFWIETLPVIQFRPDSYFIDAGEESKLKKILLILNQDPTLLLLIEGHTDKRKSNDWNLAIGERMVESVKAYLVKNGITKERLQTVSYGEERPVSLGQDKAARQENNRVEFFIQH